MGSNCEKVSSFRTRSVCICVHCMGVKMCVKHPNRVHAGPCCPYDDCSNGGRSLES